MRPPFRSDGPVLTPRGRVVLASVLTVITALVVALAASGPDPDRAAGAPLPPLTARAIR